jgi:hypothetical protein
VPPFWAPDSRSLGFFAGNQLKRIDLDSGFVRTLTSAPLPRRGVQTGRAAFYDVFVPSHWGGVISGDEITIDWDTPCVCGRTSVHIAHDIMRYSEKQGIEDVRITCSATQQVNDEAVAFMRGFEA